ncbi:hypothetical protein HPB52_024219 [Rhipicephalus sanguineus]|uniref:Uncharacterized protein n=1 Tax=Rhipicephalus sanguineus TaxID=34632 RepID=A0A9D4P9I7_RHISA|nr:hypothetical protein HPB52_024219 [Rhipicephalus sanguineus]
MATSVRSGFHAAPRKCDTAASALSRPSDGWRWGSSEAEDSSEEEGGLRTLAHAPLSRCSPTSVSPLGKERELGIPRSGPCRVPAGSLARAGDVAGCWAAPVVELVRRAGRLSDQCWMP